MRTLFVLFISIFIVSCAKDTGLIEENEIVTIRNNETDLNFILRAVHPKQIVELVSADGSNTSFSFHGNVKVFSDGKTRGKAFLGNQQLSWKYEFKEAYIDCSDGYRIVLLEGSVQVYENGRKGSKGSATAMIQSAVNDTDSPDCVIWEIDTAGGEMAEGVITPEGNIFIDNSSCEDDPR